MQYNPQNGHSRGTGCPASQQTPPRRQSTKKPYPGRASAYAYPGAATRARRQHKPWWRRRLFGRVPTPAFLAAALLLALLVVWGIVLGAGGHSGPPYTIALDAGHGGGDVGADGVITEIGMTEPTIAALYDLLAQDKNFKPVLCREYGQGASLSQRARAARRAKAALLLSVHGNADTSPDTTGFECFPVPPGRTWHEESFTFASLLAQEMGAAGANLRGEGGVRYAYFEGETRFFKEASDSTVRSEGSFTIVETPDCPAVLAEQCFVTSPADVALFAGEEGCQKAAACYYRAICRYFDVPATALEASA